MLYEHQRRFIEAGQSRHLLLWEMGTGKTLAAIEWAKENLPQGATGLVICPKMLREKWKRDVAADAPDHHFHIITKEEWRRDAAALPRYPLIIIDEIHHLAGHTSQLHRNTVKYLRRHQPTFILGLTATPYSTPWNVYGLCALMGKPIPWQVFRREFFDEVRMGSRVIPVEKKNKQSDLIAILRRFGSTVKLEDCVDMPDAVYETEEFDLTPEQKKLIKDVYDPLPIVRFTREHQICGGTLKDDGYNDPVVIPCPKSDRLVDLLAEHPRTMVVCRYLHEMEALRAKLAHIRPTFTLSGQTKGRDELVEQLKQSQEYCLIVQAQCSEGWELPACETVIFYSMSWRYIDRQQMEGRVRRINNPARRLYITLKVKDSADEAIAEAIAKREDFMAELYHPKE